MTQRTVALITVARVRRSRWFFGRPEVTLTIADLMPNAAGKPAEVIDFVVGDKLELKMEVVDEEEADGRPRTLADDPPRPSDDLRGYRKALQGAVSA